jgi:hypothetical protein
MGNPLFVNSSHKSAKKKQNILQMGAFYNASRDQLAINNITKRKR